jgi:hypothetical protein
MGYYKKLFIASIVAIIFLVGIVILLTMKSNDADADISSTMSQLSLLENKSEALRFENESLKDTIKEYDQMIGKTTVGMFKLLSHYRSGNCDAVKAMTLSDFPYDVQGLAPDASKFVNLIFQEDENISVTFDEYSRSSFTLSDEDGNEVNAAYFIKEDQVYYVSVIMVAGLLDQKLKSFVEALNAEDHSKLFKVIIEDDLSPTEDEVAMIINKYKEDYDLETINVEFVRASGNGFEYKLSGSKSNVNTEELIHVNFDDGWIYIKDYRGRYEWTGH